MEKYSKLLHFQMVHHQPHQPMLIGCLPFHTISILVKYIVETKLHPQTHSSFLVDITKIWAGAKLRIPQIAICGSQFFNHNSHITKNNVFLNLCTSSQIKKN
jgi:hypothetical protein